MIQKFEVSGAQGSGDEKLRKYVDKMVDKLERYIPRKARESAHVEVKLTEKKQQHNAKCTAEIIMYLPHEVLTAKESTINLFAAIDIVEAKLQNQLKKYKDTHVNPHVLRRLTNKLRPSER